MPYLLRHILLCKEKQQQVWTQVMKPYFSSSP